MKTLAPLFAIFLGAYSLADEPIDAKTAATIKSYSCNELEAKAEKIIGEIIRLKFSYRATDLEEDGGAHHGRVLSYIGESRKRSVDGGFGQAYVQIPKEGLDWFRKIPVNMEARGTITAIGRVEKGPFAHCVILLGREIKTDLKGSRIIW